MVIVSGNWRCFTTWTTRLVAEHGNWPFVNEPFNLDAPSQAARGGVGFRRLAEANAGLLHRYPGCNEHPDAEAQEIILALFDEIDSAFGHFEVIQLTRLLHWRLMRVAWPDCKVVYMRRRLRSWLAAVARAHVVRNVIIGDTLWGENPPWLPLAREISGRENDRSRLAIYTLGCYHLVRQQYNLKTLREEVGDDWLCVEGEQLSSQYEVEMPRLLAYCDASIPDEDEMYLAAIPPGRTWNGQPWGWRDCCEVEEAINRHRDLVRGAVQ